MAGARCRICWKTAVRRWPARRGLGQWSTSRFGRPKVRPAAGFDRKCEEWLACRVRLRQAGELHCCAFGKAWREPGARSSFFQAGFAEPNLDAPGPGGILT